jgi:pimeloyl-ACP methyl ester carboxylesterase
VTQEDHLDSQRRVEAPPQLSSAGIAPQGAPPQPGTHVVTTDDGARLHAEVAGDPVAALTVVFVHGWTLSRAIWEQQARDLGALARVVSYDQRGHGRSTWGTEVASIDRAGEDLRTVLDELVPSGPVVLAGHSMGGMCIMALAAAHPDLVARRVAGVAFVNTSAGRLADVTLGLPRLVARWFLPALMAAGARWPARFDRARRLVPPSRRMVQRQIRWLLFGPEAAAEVVLACAEIIHATGMRAIGEFYPALMTHDKHAALGALRSVPTVILVGERDRLTPPEHSWALAAALPAARLTVVPDCGHMLTMHRPGVVTSHLRDLVVAQDRR